MSKKGQMHTQLKLNNKNLHRHLHIINIKASWYNKYDMSNH